MPLLYAVVARGTTVLARHANCAGNFQEVTEQILGKITPENNKLTYSHGNYLFHYVTESRVTYLCITDDDFERSRAFLFLTDVKRKFQQQYGARALTALPYAMNSEFSRVLSNLMRHHSGTGTVNQSETAALQTQVDEIRDIMVRNIDSMTQRGERLELLVERSDTLASSSVTFRTSSRAVARQMWWRNVKFMVLLVFVVVLLLYFIVSAACGGLDWPCTRPKKPN